MLELFLLGGALAFDRDSENGKCMPRGLNRRVKNGQATLAANDSDYGVLAAA